MCVWHRAIRRPAFPPRQLQKPWPQKLSLVYKGARPVPGVRKWSCFHCTYVNRKAERSSARLPRLFHSLWGWCVSAIKLHSEHGHSEAQLQLPPLRSQPACGMLTPAILPRPSFHNLHTSWSPGSSRATSPSCLSHATCFLRDRPGGTFQRDRLLSSLRLPFPRI